MAYEPSATPKKSVMCHYLIDGDKLSPCDYDDDNNYNMLKFIDAILKIHTKNLNICILAGNLV